MSIYEASRWFGGTLTCAQGDALDMLRRDANLRIYAQPKMRLQIAHTSDKREAICMTGCVDAPFIWNIVRIALENHADVNATLLETKDRQGTHDNNNADTTFNVVHSCVT